MEELLTFEVSALQAEIATSMKEFLDGCEVKVDEEADRHARDNFALVFAGGKRAIQAGVLPLTTGGLLKAINRCFASSVASQRTIASIKSEAIDQLRKAVTNTNWVDAEQVGAETELRFISQRIAASEGERKLAVSPSLFLRWFTTAAHMQAAVRHLIEERRIALPGHSELPQQAAFGLPEITTGPRFKGRQMRAVQFTWHFSERA